MDNHQQALWLTQQAKDALRTGNRTVARHFALQAVALDSRLEEPWLILAGLSSPEASLQYLQNVLQINPNNAVAKNGMQWALQRLQNKAPVEIHDTAPVRAYKVPPSSSFKPQGAKLPVRQRTKKTNWLLPVGLGFGAILMILAFLFIVSPMLSKPARSSAAYRPIGTMAKPTLTPTITPTFTPTATFTPTSTSTPTPKPTRTPRPTKTTEPTVEPYQPYYPPDVEVEDGEHWIDVNLSEQKAYAYEGKNLVKSFIVSTGTWQHPTVTGQYNIYVKYRYADMTGPGYYLPDVPYVMYFYKGYGLHGTYWHNNFGTPMSHGCVNFTIDDAGWIFDFTDIGTLVNVHD